MFGDPDAGLSAIAEFLVEKGVKSRSNHGVDIIMLLTKSLSLQSYYLFAITKQQ